MKIYKELTIARSDSGARPGLQAVLKTFAALGVYGTSLVTASSAQNTTGVTRVLDTPAALVAAQIDAVMDDIDADAVKTGTFANTRIIRAVADKIREHSIRRLVVNRLWSPSEASCSFARTPTGLCRPTCSRWRLWSRRTSGSAGGDPLFVSSSLLPYCSRGGQDHRCWRHLAHPLSRELCGHRKQISSGLAYRNK